MLTLAGARRCSHSRVAQGDAGWRRRERLRARGKRRGERDPSAHRSYAASAVHGPHTAAYIKKKKAC